MPRIDKDHRDQLALMQRGRFDHLVSVTIAATFVRETEERLEVACRSALKAGWAPEDIEMAKRAARRKS